MITKNIFSSELNESILIESGFTIIRISDEPKISARSNTLFRIGVLSFSYSLVRWDDMNIKKCFLFLCMLSLFIPTLTVFAEEENTTESNQENKTQDAVSLIPNAKAGILIEAGSGQILFEKNKDEKLAVASMTKMVAQILILEQIEQGKLKWTDKIKASSNASGMGGSQIFLSTGEELTVEEMMKGISIN